MHASPPAPPGGRALLTRSLDGAASPAVVVSLRPVASPTSLGLFGLAAASLVLAGVQLGWVGAADRPHAGLALVGFAFPAQLLASLVAFRARDGVMATAMGVLALTWLTVGATVLSGTATGSTALGLLLAVSATAVALTGLSAVSASLATAAIFLTAGTRLGLTAVDQLSSADLSAVAGWLGVALSVLAVVVAWLSELEVTRGQSPVPLGRRGSARRAVDGGLAEQVSGIEHEPGVRARL